MPIAPPNPLHPLSKREATFDDVSLPAYCDHWVSNVVSRRGFLDTLEECGIDPLWHPYGSRRTPRLPRPRARPPRQETLGFTPKVDFNAGVVAAGEAQIESTVTGNEPSTVIPDAIVALRLDPGRWLYKTVERR